MKSFDITLFEFGEEEIQSSKTIEKTLSFKTKAKRQMLKKLKQESAKECLPFLPKENESIHIVSNGKFDFFQFVPICIQYLGGQSKEFIGSTWTMNRDNVNDLLDMLDKKMILQAGILTGLYFKQRESSVYATLVEGMQQRGQKVKCLENHAKIVLLNNAEDFITIEGSANFTANPRIEQYVITNSRELYEFHREWMLEIINGK